jgi:hypothetical protein
VQYSQTRGLPSFGNPILLNMGIDVAAFQYNKQPQTVADAPFALQPIVNTGPNFLGSTLNRKKILLAVWLSKETTS